jgi:pyrroloquinoline quinone biosynthesis protein B
VSIVRVRVLGAAAGGGVPQWNCNCSNCADVRAGLSTVKARTQSSIAVSSDGKRWVVFNASPDIRSQLDSFPALHPRADLRGSGVAAVLLTDAEIDHTAGLLFLREGGTLALYSTSFVRETLAESGLLPTLASYLELKWTEIPPGQTVELKGADASDLGLEVDAFTVEGHPPLYHQAALKRADAGGDAGSDPAPDRGSRVDRLRDSECDRIRDFGRDHLRHSRRDHPRITSEAEAHTVGVRIREPGSDRALVYVPGSGAADAPLLERIGPEDVLLWDGTFWTDDELPVMGISTRDARDMGHLPIWGAGGSLEVFRALPARRRVFIHINNTNPILREGSPQRTLVEAAGWEVAYDGMEIDI